MQDLKSCLMSAEQSAVADGGMSYSAVQLSCVNRLLQENSDLNCVLQIYIYVLMTLFV